MKIKFPIIKLLLIFIIIAGTILRLYGLNIQSLWFDELFSWYTSSNSNFWEFISHDITTVNSPPLYQIIIYIILHYLGDTEVLLRLPSAIAGIFTIYLMYRLGKLLYSEKEGLLSAAMTAVLWYPVFFSQEARVYSIFLACLLIEFIISIKLFESFKERRYPARLILFFILDGCLLFYLHYYGLYMVSLLVFFGIIIFRKDKKAILIIIISLLSVIILYIPWLSTLFKYAGYGKSWMKPPGITTFFRSIQFITSNSYPIFIIFLILLAIFTYNYLNRAFRGKQAISPNINFINTELFLLLWMVVPFIGIAIKSWISTPVFTYRYFLVSLPPLYIIAARIMLTFNISGKIGNKLRLSLIIAFLLLLFTDLIFINHYYDKTKTDYRSTEEYIMQKSAEYPNSIILVDYNFLQDNDNPPGVGVVSYYFSRKHFPIEIYSTFNVNCSFPLFMEYVREKKYEYIWYLCDDLFKEYSRDDLNRNFIKTDEKQFLKIKLYLYKIH